MSLNNHKTIQCFTSDSIKSNELNHSIHSYPAKFPYQIPRAILNDFSQPDYIVFDPFCGSGTTLTEASLKGLKSIGNDINPIATLLSKVKTTYYSNDDFSIFDHILKNIQLNYNNTNDEVIESYKITRDFHGRDHWFQKNVQFEIELILKEINNCNNQKVQDLLRVILSDIIISVSNQESDTRYAAKQKNINNGETIKKLLKKAQNVKNQIEAYSKAVGDVNAFTKIISCDARNIDIVEGSSIDIIITSPPYANTYDYYLYHKQRMNWLGFDFKETQQKEIGSRYEYSSKKQGADKWVDDLNSVLKEMYRVLKNNRYAFIIIGDSVIKKELISIEKIVSELSINIGFEVVNIESVPLSKNSRKFNNKFGSSHPKLEHVIHLYKS